jgi:hypothetical protein
VRHGYDKLGWAHARQAAPDAQTRITACNTAGTVPTTPESKSCGAVAVNSMLLLYTDTLLL